MRAFCIAQNRESADSASHSGALPPSGGGHEHFVAYTVRSETLACL